MVFNGILLLFQIFMALSVAGTVFQGYFFAFHLLNIVNNNQLLKGVIQAVTKNGEFIKTDISSKCPVIAKPRLQNYEKRNSSSSLA